MPTYNRAELLRRACEKLIERIREEKLVDQVQVCISDNASPDHTEQVAKSFIGLGVDVTYHRNDKNVGFARNFIQVASMADAEYILLAGDDDWLIDGALTLILDVVRPGYGVAVFGPPNPAGYLAREKTDVRTVLRSATHLIDALGQFHTAFIGSFVIRRDAYLKYQEPFFLQSSYPHVCVLLTALRHTEGVHVRTLLFGIDDSHRRLNQPLLASVDMARVMTMCVFRYGATMSLIHRVYWEDVRNIPRAILRERLGKTVRDKSSQFTDISLMNVLGCYGGSRIYQALAFLFWCIAKVLPTSTLEMILNDRAEVVNVEPVVSGP